MRTVAPALCVLAAVALAGCGGDAAVEMSAARALHEIADTQEAGAEEYFNDLALADDLTEAEVIAAFIARVQADVDDELALGEHKAAFVAALQKIRSDRETNHARYARLREAAQALREMGGDLDNIARQSLSLNDELYRYLGQWSRLEQARRTEAGEARAVNRFQQRLQRAAAQAAALKSAAQTVLGRERPEAGPQASDAAPAETASD